MGVMDAAGKEPHIKSGNASSDKFIHSVPVPHLYKEASKILLRYEKKEGTLKKLVFENKRYKDFRRLYATVCKAVDNAKIIQDAFIRIKLFEQEPRFNPQMAQVLASELLFANKVLSGECLPVLTILRYKKELQSAIATVGNTKEKKEKEHERNPRYARVNTLLTSAEKVHAELVKEGWKQITYDGEFVSYMDFLNLVKKLDGKDYLCDYHVPDLLVFPHNTPFWSSWLYKKNYIILQDKASCLPVILADFPAEAEIIDACAAPGNKTSHLAARMGNSGKIYAVEKDNKRFQTLTKLLDQRGVTNVEYLNNDFTRLKKEHYEKVSHIILDPSCSSTGMNIHQDELTSERLKKLSSFQASILCFALSFPNVEAVTYSTCSIHEEENEEVVNDALKKFGDQFELENIGEKLKGWKHYGKKKYPFGHLCLKTKFSVDKCHGFFVAKFVRKHECELEKDENWKSGNEEKKGMNKVFNGAEEEMTDTKINKLIGEHNGRESETRTLEIVEESAKKKKKKKGKRLEANVTHQEASTGMSVVGTELIEDTKSEVENQMKTLDCVEESCERVRSKKRKKKSKTDIEPLNTEVGNKVPDVCGDGDGATAEAEEETVMRKKKKKKRKSEVNVTLDGPAASPVDNSDVDCTAYSPAKGMKRTKSMKASDGHEEPKVKKKKKSRADTDSSATVEITCEIVGLSDVEETVNTAPVFEEVSMDKKKKKKKKRKLEDNAFSS